MHDPHAGDGKSNGEIVDPRILGHLAEVLNECQRITVTEGPVRGEFVSRWIADMVIVAGQSDDDDPLDASR